MHKQGKLVIVLLMSEIGSYHSLAIPPKVKIEVESFRAFPENVLMFSWATFGSGDICGCLKWEALATLCSTVTPLYKT